MLFDYNQFPNHQILCIDMKSFYASAEAAARGLDPLQSQIAVVGDLNRPGSVVLAASPALKKRGIKTGNRLYEIPNDPQIHIIKARMGYYLDLSLCVTDIFNRFVPKEAIHTYSVDEAWLTLDGSERLNGTAREVAKLIQTRLLIELGLPCSIARGPNKLLAKLALDNYAKRSLSGYVEIEYHHVRTHLWPLPVQDIWGIGSRMQRNLNRMGIRTLGDLAAAPLNTLTRKYGVMGEQLYYHAWGIDLSPVFVDPRDEIRKGVSHGITLMRDYTTEEAKIVLYELTDLITGRLRKFSVAARTVSLSLQYSKTEILPSYSRSRTLSAATNLSKRIYDCLIQLLNQAADGPIRHIGVSASNLIEDTAMQLDLFEFQENEKLLQLAGAVDQIRNRFGTAAIVRASSYTEAGTIIDRAGKIGGHYE